MPQRKFRARAVVSEFVTTVTGVFGLCLRIARAVKPFFVRTTMAFASISSATRAAFKAMVSSSMFSSL